MFSIFRKSGPARIPDIDAQELHRATSSSDAPFILDVRRPEEFAEAHIAGAALVPLHELTGRISELPRNRAIVCVCRSGSRSAAATAQLSAAGFDASNLSGGMISWLGAGLPVDRGKLAQQAPGRDK